MASPFNKKLGCFRVKFNVERSVEWKTFYAEPPTGQLHGYVKFQNKKVAPSAEMKQGCNKLNSGCMALMTSLLRAHSKFSSRIRNNLHCKNFREGFKS